MGMGAKVEAKNGKAQAEDGGRREVESGIFSIDQSIDLSP
jgi:hypothetical protein